MKEGDIICAKNLAVILIDMQNVFTEKIEKEELKIMIDNQLIILEVCAKHNIPLFILEYQDCGDTISILKEKIEKITRKKTIIKPDIDGFSYTPLSIELEKLNTKKIIFAGIYAGACVYETAYSAIKNGYKIIICAELISDMNYFFDNKKSWYIKNGLFYSNIQDLLAKIKV